MTRGLFIAAMALAILLAGPNIPGSPAAAGEPVCDLKGSVNFGPLSDGGLEFYRRQEVHTQGSGFPPSVMLELRVYADGVLVHHEELPVLDDGTVARRVTFIGFLVEPSDEPVDFLVTVHDPADPGTCSDQVDFVRLPDPPFDDILRSIFLDEIVWLYDAGLVVGCMPAFFCPENAVTRGEMAVLLVRALALPATADDFFTDDDGHKYEWAINRLAAAGVATGCAADAFCPRNLITRAEMASFLVAGFELAPSDTNAFTDDDGSSHESAINALAAAGVTTGCSRFAPERFCPDRFVTRGQLAAFLFRALQ
jgi:hypothetical protein